MHREWRYPTPAQTSSGTTTARGQPPRPRGGRLRVPRRCRTRCARRTRCGHARPDCALRLSGRARPTAELGCRRSDRRARAAHRLAQRGGVAVMSANALWVWLALAAVIGFILGWLVMALRASRAEQQLGLELENARTRLKSQEALELERNSALERAKERVTVAFDGLARTTLRSNSELFLKLAHESFGQQHLQATHALKERE